MITKEADSSVENLAALIGRSPGSNARPIELIMLMGAARDVKGEGKIVAYFMALLLIRSDITTPADRRTVDDWIGHEAAWIYHDLQSEGDLLIQSPPGGWGYGEDGIKEAHDVIRNMQALFACAAEDK
jgi:hypothetical protein